MNAAGVCAFAVALLTTNALGGRIVAFERDNSVWLANLDGTGIRKIADGKFPSISADGSRVAFNTQEKIGDSYVRQIAVIELATDHITTFKEVPSKNSYYPAWSPDGKQLVFTLYDPDVWNLGLINSDGTGFRFLKKGAPKEATLFAPCWGRDGQTVFCQNMTSIFQLGLDGGVREEWQIDKIIPNGNMTGDERIDVSPDGKRLLLSIEMAEEHDRGDWDGPVPALWVFEIATQKPVRITSKTLFAWDGRWLDDQNILFLNQNSGETTASLYRMGSRGENLKLLVRDARMPSVSAP